MTGPTTAADKATDKAAADKAATADKAAADKAAEDKSTADKDTSTKTTGNKVGRYRVIAPYVTLKSKSETGGDVVLGYYEGALVPETVDLDDLARHIRKGYVEKLEGAEAKAVDKAEAEAAKAEAAEEKAEDKEGAEAVKEAEADKAAADKAAEEEVAKAKKERTPLLRASDSPRGAKTAQTG